MHMKLITGMLLLILVGSSVLAGCGQKGDLYLPDEREKETQTKKP